MVVIVNNRARLILHNKNRMAISIRHLTKKMDRSKEHFRHCLLFLYQKNFNASAAHRDLATIFGEDCLSERECRRWFEKFNAGNFSLEDETRSGRPVELENNVLLASVRDNPRLNSWQIAEEIGSSHSTVARHLADLGFVKKLGNWIPHSLRDDQLEQRVTICSSLLSRRRNFEWLKDIVTGDEKWVMYTNQNRQRQWVLHDEIPEPEAKTETHGKKILLTVFWDYKGIIHFELLKPNTTINAEHYCYQLDRLKNLLSIERPEKDHIILLHDNARPHTARLTQNKIVNEFGWEILPHPPYSPDLAPTDYWLFRNLSNHLRGKIFSNFEQLNYDIRTYFNSISPNSFADGIYKLPERWQHVVDNDGAYCI